MWVIDIRHWLDEETQSRETVPQLKRKVKKLGEMVGKSLVLHGICTTCGGELERFIEGEDG